MNARLLLLLMGSLVIQLTGSQLVDRVCPFLPCPLPPCPDPHPTYYYNGGVFCQGCSVCPTATPTHQSRLQLGHAALCPDLMCVDPNPCPVKVVATTYHTGHRACPGCPVCPVQH